MAQSHDKDYYDYNVYENVEIGIPQHGWYDGLVDKDNFLIIDTSAGQHYADPNNEKAMERYLLTTDNMRVVIDGHGSIVLPDGTLAKDEIYPNSLNESARHEIESFSRFLSAQKDYYDPDSTRNISAKEYQKPDYDRYGLYSGEPHGYNFNLERLPADRDTDRTHELYTTLRLEAYDRDRDILILNDSESNQRYFTQILDKTDEHSFKYDGALWAISKENAYNGGPEGKDILIPNKEINISVTRDCQEIADFRDNGINHSLLNPENYTIAHLDPSRTDTFRVEGCVDLNEQLRLNNGDDPYFSRFGPDYAVVLTSLSDNSTHVIYPDCNIPFSLEGTRQEVITSEIAIEPYAYHPEVTLPVDDKGDILIVPNVDEHGNLETFSTDFFEYSPAEGLVIHEEMFYEKDRDWDRDYDWGPSDGRDDPELP